MQRAGTIRLIHILKLRGWATGEASTPHLERDLAHLGAFQLILIDLGPLKLFWAHLSSFQFISFQLMHH